MKTWLTIVGTFLFAAAVGYVLRMVTAPKPVETTHTVVVHDTLPRPPPVILKPNPVPAQVDTFTAAQKHTLDSVLASSADKDYIIDRLARPHYATQYLEAIDPTGLKISGLQHLTYTADVTLASDGYFRNDIVLDTIFVDSEVVYIEHVETVETFDWKLAGGVLVGGIAAGIVTGVLISK